MSTVVLATKPHDQIVKLFTLAVKSNFTAERDNAILAIGRILERENLEPADVIVAAPAAPVMVRCPTDHVRDSDLEFLQRHISACTDWETRFVRSVSMQRSLTQKQRDIVLNTAQKLRRRGFL